MLKRIGLFYIIALLLTILLAGLQQATGIGGKEFILPQWGPGLAALVMLLLFRGDNLSLRPVARRVDLPRYAAALALPLLIAVVMLPPANRFLGSIDAAAGLRALTPLWLAGMLFGALGEELGWRGYLQPVARPRLGAFGASLLVGLLWALWHVQHWANGPVYMLCLVLAMIGYSLTITTLIGGAPGGGVLIATLFHLGINVGNVVFIDNLTQTGFMALNAAVWLAVAAAAVYLRRDLFFARPSGDTRPATS